jgi:hypothetical protein
MFSKLFKLICMTSLALSLAVPMSAQVLKGSISGIAEDNTGAIVAHASVHAKNTGTAAVFTTTTDDAGLFRLNLLPVGEYSVEISAPKFKTALQQGVTVTAGKDSDLGTVKIEVGEVTVTVDVTAVAPLITSTQSQVTNSFSSSQISNIPGIRENEGLDNLAVFFPGVSSARDNNLSNTNGGTGLSVNGLRGRNNDQQIDGQNNNDNHVGGPSLLVGDSEFVSEYVVVTDQFGPEYGRNAGSVVNVITKSGANAWHGSVYGTENNSVLNTRNNFQSQFQNLDSVPRANDEFGGGTVGGAILKNKLFVFGGFSQELLSQSSVYSTQQLTPTPTGLQTLAGCFPNSSSIAALSAYGPYAISAGNPTPDAATLSTINVSGCGAPVQAAGLSRTLSTPQHIFNWILRSDAQFTNDTVNARYIFNRSNQFNLEPIPGDGATGDVINAPALSQAVLLSWTHTFKSNTVNEGRVAFDRVNVAFGGNNVDNPFLPGPGNIADAMTRISFQDPTLLGFGPEAMFPQGRIVNTWQAQDNWNHLMERHQLKAGANFTYQRSPNTALTYLNGNYRFSDWSQFAANAPNRIRIAQGDPLLDFREYDTFLYAGDDWKLRSNLTLNLGLTWSYYGQPANLFNDLSTQNETGINPLFNPALPLSVRTVPRLNSVKDSFGPSFGFAYSPQWGGAITGNGRTVIRGGYRMLYDPPFYNVYTAIAGSAPMDFLQTLSNPAGLPQYGLPSVPTGPNVRASLAAALTPGTLDPRNFNQTTLAPNFGPDRVHTWSLGIERQLTKNSAVEARYVGNHAADLFQSVNGNPEIADLATAFPNLVPAGVTPCTNPAVPAALGRENCNEGVVQERTNGGFSNYNALQLEYRTNNLFNQLSLRTGYTYSKTLDNVSEVFSTFAAGNTMAYAQNPLNTGNGEYSYSGLDYPNQWTTMFTEQLPFFRDQRGLLGHAFGGWSLSGSYVVASGQRYTPVQAGAEALSSAAADYYDAAFVLAFANADIARPFVGSLSAPAGTAGIYAGDAGINGLPATQLVSVNALNNGQVVKVNQSDVRYIINAATAQSVFGTPFGAARNLSQDALSNIANFGVTKSVKLGETASFEFRSTMLNVFNHANYQSVDPIIEDAGLSLQGEGFGNPSLTNTGSALGNRRILFGGTFRF